MEALVSMNFFSFFVDHTRERIYTPTFLQCAQTLSILLKERVKPKDKIVILQEFKNNEIIVKLFFVSPHYIVSTVLVS